VAGYGLKVSLPPARRSKLLYNFELQVRVNLQVLNLTFSVLVPRKNDAPVNLRRGICHPTYLFLEDKQSAKYLIKVGRAPGKLQPLSSSEMRDAPNKAK